MATWSGWQNQLLNRAGIIVTPPNRRLLSLWASNAHTSCANNPIDLSHKLSGSSNCASLTGIFPQAQRYGSHAQAATAFRDEIHADFAHNLLAAMNTGNPFQVANFNDVGSVFVSWGTPKMLDVYLAAAQSQQPGAGSSGGKSTRAHSGWHDLRRAINHNMPSALRRAHKNHRAALRTLGKARKVRL